MSYSQSIKKLLLSALSSESISVNEPMCNHTCFHIGGPADFLVEPSTIDEIQNLLPLLQSHKIPVTIIGNGSNLLVRDKGIRGVVIKIAQNFSSYTIEETMVKVQAGILLSRLSHAITSSSLTGFEFASGIPGTLGGALFMNAGAYGGEIKDIVSSVDIISDQGKLYTLTHEEMEFGYRKSFLGKANNHIAIQATLKLSPGDPQEIRNRIEDLTLQRTTKQPVRDRCAGSTFKRPTGFYAGKLIEDCGLQGFQHGGAKVSDLHTGFVVNHNNATANDVLELIEIIQKKVETNFGILLEPEIKIIGEK